jgi:hypothetical protein
MLMRGDAEANLNRARSPGHRMADDELLNPSSHVIQAVTRTGSLTAFTLE